MTEDGSEKRSKRKICTPTKVNKLIISIPDIQAHIESASSYFSTWWVRSAHLS